MRKHDAIVKKKWIWLGNLFSKKFFSFGQVDPVFVLNFSGRFVSDSLGNWSWFLAQGEVDIPSPAFDSFRFRMITLKS